VEVFSFAVQRVLFLILMLKDFHSILQDDDAVLISLVALICGSVM
jgi:hypothetical protein